jgi:acetate kinase
VSAGGVVLAVNAGSSSLKVAAFRQRRRLERILNARVERIGGPDPELSVDGPGGEPPARRPVEAPDHAACVEPLAGELGRRLGGTRPLAVGHRVVHGGPRLGEPGMIDAGMLAELRALRPLDPLHLPAQIALVEAFQRQFPDVPQVACFDTAFHRDLPRVAAIVPVPRRYEALGLRRYGFHGISYEFLLEELARRAGERAARGRVILAHLGNGASMAAVRDGRSVETTMALTPAAGLVMGTRPGDLDPGVGPFLARVEGMTPKAFDEMVNTRSGLLGVSETSADVRDLLDREGEDPRAAEALALFCYRARTCIGALAAALRGLDALVFSGGIGEASPVVRSRICDGLEFLGVALDPGLNARGEDLISAPGGRVEVRVIATDEERRIAQSAYRIATAAR